MDKSSTNGITNRETSQDSNSRVVSRPESYIEENISATIRRMSRTNRWKIDGEVGGPENNLDRIPFYATYYENPSFRMKDGKFEESATSSSIQRTNSEGKDNKSSYQQTLEEKNKYSRFRTSDFPHVKRRDAESNMRISNSSEQHHYLPLLHQNFNRPSPSKTIHLPKPVNFLRFSDDQPTEAYLGAKNGTALNIRRNSTSDKEPTVVSKLNWTPVDSESSYILYKSAELASEKVDELLEAPPEIAAARQSSILIEEASSNPHLNNCKRKSSFDNQENHRKLLENPIKSADDKLIETTKVSDKKSILSTLIIPETKMPSTNNTENMITSRLEHSNSFSNEDSPACAYWNPSLLLDKLYEISYNPRKESKRNRFTNMEGHLDVPVKDERIVAELHKNWMPQYFRTKDGRLQWFATHFADDCPIGEVLLSGCDVNANKEEGLISIHGGRDHVKLLVRVPPPTNLFDKWRIAINSHAASSYMDAFVHPVYPPVPHISEKIAIVELGSCSIRAGILTMEPSLPQTFFPALAVMNNGEYIVGSEALLPQNRRSGELLQPIKISDPSLERYTVNKSALKACIQKCVKDLNIEPKKYKVLLSISQNFPAALIGELLQMVIQEIGFEGVAIARQPSLILYAHDVTTGIVVDIGNRLNIVPVIDGYVVENAIVSLPCGASQIIDSLHQKLIEANVGLSFPVKSHVEHLILRYILEQACFVSTDFESDVKKCSENASDMDMTISLSEFNPCEQMASSFTINSARFTACEGLFKPKRWEIDTKALHQLVFEAVQLSPIDSRKTLLRNIYIAGGASLLPGLAERLEVELSSLVASTIHTQVHVSPWRYHGAYLGAQIVASSSQFEQTCITSENLNNFIKQLQSSTF